MDFKQPNIAWIFGPPGAGKSAIATTLVRDFSGMLLCAKFSAKRDIADRGDPKRVWRTLAYSLAGLHIGLKGSIMQALIDIERSHNSQITSVADQFRDLIVKTMQDQRYLSVVVVIDALDECFTEKNEDWRVLLQTIAGWTNLPWSFRLVVTSRDIPDIRSVLAKVSYPISITTGNETSIEAKSDIRLFFQRKFAIVAKDFTDMSLDWPGKEVVQKLTEYAAGSFIWAKMVVELVGKLGPQAVDRIEDILGGIELGSVELLYNLYAKMLFDVFAQLDEKERSTSRSVLAAIVLAKDPLRKGDLVDLLSSIDSPVDVTRRSVEDTLDQLSCIISVDDNQLLRIPHKSFSDFFLDHRRSSTAMRHFVPEDQKRCSYLINHEGDSATMAIKCLHLMTSSLTFNACSIKTSHCLNDDIPDLAALISENISTALIYSCRFWAVHFRDFPRSDGRLRAVIQPLLRMLLCEKVLYWLEILSLAGAVLSAGESLQSAAEYLKVCLLL